MKRISLKEGNFATISNKILMDKNLSGDAFRVLTILLNNKDDWKIFLCYYSNHFGWGEKKQSNIIKELIAEGFLLREKKSTGKSFVYNYQISESGCFHPSKRKDGNDETLQPSKKQDGENEYSTSGTFPIILPPSGVVPPLLTGAGYNNTNKNKTNKNNTDIDNNNSNDISSNPPKGRMDAIIQDKRYSPVEVKSILSVNGLSNGSMEQFIQEPKKNSGNIALNTNGVSNSPQDERNKTKDSPILPPSGMVKVGMERLKEKFGGYLVEVIPNENERKKVTNEMKKIWKNENIDSKMTENFRYNFDLMISLMNRARTGLKTQNKL